MSRRSRKASDIAKKLLPYMSKTESEPSSAHTHNQYLTTAKGDARYVKRGQPPEAADHDHDSDYEAALGAPGTDGYVLSSTAAGMRSWVQRAALAVAQTWTALQTFSSGIETGKIIAETDSATAIQLTKANGTTAVLTIDTSTLDVIVTGTFDVSSNADVGGDLVIAGGLTVEAPTVPGSASATGTAGEIAWDSVYLYVCTGTNTWKRVTLATW